VIARCFPTSSAGGCSTRGACHGCGEDGRQDPKDICPSLTAAGIVGDRLWRYTAGLLTGDPLIWRVLLVAARLPRAGRDARFPSCC
jgi:hypothetical protein